MGGETSAVSGERIVASRHRSSGNWIQLNNLLAIGLRRLIFELEQLAAECYSQIILVSHNGILGEHNTTAAHAPLTSPPVSITQTLPLLRPQHSHRRPLTLQLRLAGKRKTQCPRNRSADLTRAYPEPIDRRTKPRRTCPHRALGQQRARKHKDKTGG